MEEMFENERWCGIYDGKECKDLSGLDCKALLSDSTSGGVSVNPNFFDANLVTFPLLSGELFPMVTLSDVPRGSTVSTASVATPTMAWGTGEGTSMPLFDTASLISAITSSIYPVMASIEVGRDFLSDAAANVGQILQEVLGERFAAELDKVIAGGNGTNRPEGITVASGLGSATFGGTTVTVDDYESLLFGVAKQYRTSNRCAFLSNDVSYRRARAIPVAATWASRVFGMNEEDYQLLGRPYKIQQDLANTVAVFGDMSRYRLYRRQGFTIEWHTQGQYLARKNIALLVCRGRFGGKVMDGSAFCKATDAQA
jgi:HK97 family phage major capsid protein